MGKKGLGRNAFVKATLTKPSDTDAANADEAVSIAAPEPAATSPVADAAPPAALQNGTFELSALDLSRAFLQGDFHKVLGHVQANTSQHSRCTRRQKLKREDLQKYPSQKHQASWLSATRGYAVQVIRHHPAKCMSTVHVGPLCMRAMKGYRHFHDHAGAKDAQGGHEEARQEAPGVSWSQSASRCRSQ